MKGWLGVILDGIVIYMYFYILCVFLACPEEIILNVKQYLSNQNWLKFVKYILFVFGTINDKDSY